jgi:hypothetical protein
MRCYFCRKTDDVVDIHYTCIYDTDVCICDDCETIRNQLRNLIKSPDTVITLDLYRASCHYEISCKPPKNASILDIFVAMDS